MADSKANEQGGEEEGKLADESTGKRRAAVFLVTMGSDIASEVFKHMREDEIEMLTWEIARVGKITPAERDSVLNEFQELLAAKDFISTGGIDYAKELLEKAVGSRKAVDIINKLTSSLKSRPFEFLRKTEPTHLLNFLQQEHPQTIALVLAYIDPQKAAVVLSELGEDVQSDVVKRIASMEQTSPETIREVERVLDKKLSTINQEDMAEAGGIQSSVEIINLIDRTTEKKIMEQLEEEDPELAEEIRKRMFVFENIVMLDDKGIQRVLRDVDNADLTKALKAVDEEVKDKVLGNMSKRAAAMLVEEMEVMGPTKRSDIEEAQQKVVGVIRKLEEEGEIVIARGGEDDVVM